MYLIENMDLHTANVADTFWEDYDTELWALEQELEGGEEE